MPEASVTSIHTEYTARRPLTTRKGLWRAPPMTDATVAYSAAQKASNMANEPRFSISPLDAALALIDIRRGLAGRQLPRLGFVLRGALGLNLGGAEHAILVEFAVGEGLGAVAEGIRQGIAARVRHFQFQLILNQHKLHLAAGALDRPALHVTPHAEPFSVRLVSHLAQLGNGLIVGLGFVHPGSGEPRQGADHHGDQRGEFAVFF